MISVAAKLGECDSFLRLCLILIKEVRNTLMCTALANQPADAARGLKPEIRGGKKNTTLTEK